ncbi:hypothetical protein [Cellvibrio sp.]
MQSKIMDTFCPSLIGHVRPIVFVETGFTFQPLFIDIQNEAFIHGIQS